MNYYVLDTNTIIYFLQGNESVIPIFDRIIAGEFVPIISVITKIELLSFPDITSEEEKKIRLLFSVFEVYDIDDDVVEMTVGIRKRYGLKIPDAIVASTAMVNEAGLVTRNEKDFEKVDGLKIINPFA